MGRDNLKKKVAEVSPPCQRAVLHGDLADEPDRKGCDESPLKLALKESRGLEKWFGG